MRKATITNLLFWFNLPKSLNGQLNLFFQAPQNFSLKMYDYLKDTYLPVICTSAYSYHILRCKDTLNGFPLFFKFLRYFVLPKIIRIYIVVRYTETDALEVDKDLNLKFWTYHFHYVCKEIYSFMFVYFFIFPGKLLRWSSILFHTVFSKFYGKVGNLSW